MKKGRFSGEQMVGILREADRSPVAQVAKKHGISEQTIYTWRKQFAGMSADDVERLRLLEQENTRPKKILAERDLEIEVIMIAALPYRISTSCVVSRSLMLPFEGAKTHELCLSRSHFIEA